MRILCVSNPSDINKRVWLNGEEVSDQTWEAKVPNRPGVTGLGWVNRYERDTERCITLDEGGEPTSYKSHGLVRWAQAT